MKTSYEHATRACTHEQIPRNILPYLQTTTSASSLSSGGIGWDWGHILNASNLESSTSQSSKGRLSSWSRSLGSASSGGTELDVQGIDAQVLHSGSDILGGKHSSIRRRLITISLHLHSSGHTAQGFLSRQISHVDESVVERSKDVSNTPDEFSLSVE